MRIAILGFGREGRAVLKYLKKNKAYKNAEISILDKNTSPDYLKNLASFDLIFRSPGVPFNSSEIQNAVKAGVKFSSATKIFFDEAPCQIIGVTGTKGKGTTSTLLYKIFKAAKKDVRLAGNIGKPAIEILPKLKKNSIAILELSSFQLHDLHKSPNIAVILDIFPDHMDSHTDFNDYFDAKANIAKHQNSDNKVFYFADNEHSRNMATVGSGQKIGVDENKFGLLAPGDLKIPGPHNFKNAMMAANVALDFGIAKSIILKTVKNFHGLAHRLELVRELKITPANYSLIRANKRINKSSIRFYDDSASTNPQTSAAAIRAFTEPVILIAGGKDKNLDYAPLATVVRKSKNLKAIILFGENKFKIAKHLSPEFSRLRRPDQGVNLKITDDLKTAVSIARRQAENLISLKAISYKLKAIVVFSPGAASFDMFRDYADRGEKFTEIVKKLK